MRTHRFGKKLKLPWTIAIKHQLRTLMREDLVKKAEEAAPLCSDISAVGAQPALRAAESRRRA
jgi:hypothetical protein